MSNQVVVIGGGVMGLVARLLADAPRGRRPGVTVVEREPPRTSMRRPPFRPRPSVSNSRPPVNVLVSQAQHRFFLRNAAVELSVDGDEPDIMLREVGYLYLAGAGGAAAAARGACRAAGLRRRYRAPWTAPILRDASAG